MINESVFEAFPIVESERLIFRAFRSEDAKDILLIRSNKSVMRYMDSEIHDSVVHAQEFVEWNLSAHKNKTGICWAIIDKASDTFIGDFSFWKLDRTNHRGEIGYTLKPEFWGKGYMQETMRALFDFGFKELNLHSIEANINPANDNSRNILLKMGFKKEAYFKEHYFYNGVYLDSEIYSLLDNWMKR